MVNRRAFLAWLGGTAAGVAASQVWDVERMLWVPGKKAVFFPTPRQLKFYASRGNTFITPAWVTKDIAMVRKNSIKLKGEVLCHGMG